jgi:hypothetical protein
VLVNSVPLSETIVAGRPRIAITSSSSRATPEHAVVEHCFRQQLLQLRVLVFQRLQSLA